MTELTLPARAGERPMTQRVPPHLQLDQPSPDEIRERLTRWMGDHLPDTMSGSSEISVPGTVAYFLRPHVRPATGAVLMPPRYTAEYAHVHADGSLHLCLALADQQKLLDQGWGERHPLYGQDNHEVMLYAPRTPDELDIAKTVIAACYRYATGRTM
ncbi:luciferase family protein [Nonomuraea sp. B12E4]|uniref:luciferase domain-containing protein n=1 Tax=Nonomuraea sp. B12E4 TaxID=3153564 RepID=UPI00325CF4DA